MNIEQKFGELIDAPAEIGGKLGVFGSSATVIKEHTMIFMGGSLPPPGIYQDYIAIFPMFFIL